MAQDTVKSRNPDSPSTAADLKGASNELLISFYKQLGEFRESKIVRSNNGLSLYALKMSFFIADLVNVDVDAKERFFEAINGIFEAHREKFKILNGRHAGGEDVIERVTQSLETIRDSLKLHSDTDELKLVELPENAPVLYQPRQSGKASKFLTEHWRRYIEAGVCFRPDIKRLDPKLEMALRNEFRGKPEALRKLLPNKADEVDARLASAFGVPVAPEKRRSAITQLSIAKRLKAPHA